MYSLPAFLEVDMYKKVILQIVLPPLDANSYIVKTFKVGFVQDKVSITS